MRGPIQGIPALLMPVAHVFMQLEEDIMQQLETIPERYLWERPARAASIAFHVQHIAGVIDRMCTYSRNEPLREEQFTYLENEGVRTENLSKAMLIDQFRAKIAVAMQYLSQVDERQLSETRYLGRKRIPTTLIGLLFHAAEHGQRHFGQLLVTAKWLQSIQMD